MISDNAKLMIHGLSDVGLVRGHNEDKIAWDENLGLVLLADGMGGHNAGEVASELAVNCIIDSLRGVLIPDVDETLDRQSAVDEAIQYANNEIVQVALERQECAGMGTTIVLSLFYDNSVIFGHVGDSRIYRYREGSLSQITTDHSLVQEMVDNGYISEEEALTSASRNLITRALGIADTVDVDVIEDDCRTNDLYLLCSDGLTDLVTDDEIAGIFKQYSYMEGYSASALESIVTSLVSSANEKGGKDNISTVLVARLEAFSDTQGLDE
ncbi:Protein serine/threonine phosphatase PrpC, regulation of stationary phase [hydrothermal vent metagenome]|uniref:Protein serine/threonine phosphatase PrpC, regulation of stationary phase n=1 Tax=hydrothermal vent metagenome TaxID=652676 RepID=A0A3B1BQS7_9ZZZZ